MAQKGCFMRGVLIFSRPPEAEDTPLHPPRAQNGLRTVKNVVLSENEAASGPKRLSYARSAHSFNAKCTLEWPLARFLRRKVHLGVASGGLDWAALTGTGRLCVAGVRPFEKAKKNTVSPPACPKWTLHRKKRGSQCAGGIRWPKKAVLCEDCSYFPGLRMPKTHRSTPRVPKVDFAP